MFDRLCRRASVLCLVAGLTALAGVAQAGDLCSAPTPLTVGVSVPFDTTTAGNDTPDFAGCVGNLSNDLFYTFTSGAAGTYTVSLCGSGFDTALAIFSTCSDTTALACNDDACGLQSRINFPMTASTTYLIRVSGFSTASGTGTIVVNAPASPPANDTCATATPLSVGVSVPFDTTAANNSTPDFGCVGDTSNDIFYSFLAPTTDTYTVSLCGSGYDTALAIFSTCSDTSALICNDDACGLSSRIEYPMTAGTTYLIRVSGFLTASGPGTIVVNAPVPPPANDLCANAQAVGEGSFPFNNASAGTEGSLSCGFGGDTGVKDIWFAYTATVSGLIGVDTCATGGTATDTQIAVFDICPNGSETEIACNDDACGLRSSTGFTAVAGTTYIIRVSSYTGSVAGTGTLTIQACTGYSGPTFSTTEPEPCFVPTFDPVSNDTVNGGCNSTPNVFGTIACGETVRGWGSVNPGIARDTDWYQFTLTSPDTVTLTGNAQFPAQMLLVGGDCTSIVIIASTSNTFPCNSGMSLSASVPAGTYTAFVSPSGFDEPECDPNGQTQYWMNLSLSNECTGPCDGLDFNNDGVFPDSQDITDLLSVFGGGPCSNDPYCGDIDFNNDGVAPDNEDIFRYLSVYGGGSCI